MTLPRFLQIHTLHNYPAALLNRDDAGLAKRLPYGDKVRTRISSQCLKRHWRVADDVFALKNLGMELEKRSTYFLDEVRKFLLTSGIQEDVALAAVEGLAEGLKLKRDEKKKDKFKTKEVLFLGINEVDYLNSFTLEIAKQHADAKVVRTAVKDYVESKPKDAKGVRENLKVMFEQCSLASALFGRMVTSDVLASRDAAVYVAHAFTVHEAQVENDYFTAVDDILNDADETGSAGIFDTELASGLYYGYVVVDVPQLMANLEGVHIKDWANATPEQRALAGRVVLHLLHLIATVSPGAKRGSTAPFEWAKFMLVEAGDWQPRSLAGAFQNALPQNQPALRKAAVQRIADEAAQLDAAYGAPLVRRYLAVDDVQLPGAERLPLKALAEWAQAIVTRAEA
ncbi:type I-E CRISPR-associated protein Cas7/Cse4/CasC [Pseudorhodoferax sp.]|uniref:type I-E CRISPR-associated protein Cas7/Cse4/CasC n=1 Tax=Pseudorhodoferax sp. TaxID=1993553 RepID=UPI002DD61BE6|nr:type I-E CRISPR-associated protein Cas7/Cse4/CasC [Pseudorhodoferax sp.]